MDIIPNSDSPLHVAPGFLWPVLGAAPDLRMATVVACEGSVDPAATEFIAFRQVSKTAFGVDLGVKRVFAGAEMKWHHLEDTGSTRR